MPSPALIEIENVTTEPVGIQLTARGVGEGVGIINAARGSASREILDILRRERDAYHGSADWELMGKDVARLNAINQKRRQAQAEIVELEALWETAVADGSPAEEELEQQLRETRAELAALERKEQIIATRAAQTEAATIAKLNAAISERLEEFRRFAESEMERATAALVATIGPALVDYLAAVSRVASCGGWRSDFNSAGLVATIVGEVPRPTTTPARTIGSGATKLRAKANISIHGASSKDPDRNLKPGDVVLASELPNPQGLISSGVIEVVDDE